MANFFAFLNGGLQLKKYVLCELPSAVNFVTVCEQLKVAACLIYSSVLSEWEKCTKENKALQHAGDIGASIQHVRVHVAHDTNYSVSVLTYMCLFIFLCNINLRTNKVKKLVNDFNSSNI